MVLLLVVKLKDKWSILSAFCHILFLANNQCFLFLSLILSAPKVLSHSFLFSFVCNKLNPLNGYF